MDAGVVKDFITDPEVALLITIILGGLVTVATAFVTGKIVPRFIYDEKVKQLDKQLDINERMAQALKDLTEEIRRENR
jgi:hypothetical protein